MALPCTGLAYSILFGEVFDNNAGRLEDRAYSTRKKVLCER
jgi:hypothetical protein